MKSAIRENPKVSKIERRIKPGKRFNEISINFFEYGRAAVNKIKNKVNKI